MITERQRELLGIIARQISEHGTQPSYREIARQMNIASLNAIRSHVVALEKKGIVTRQPGNSRSIAFAWRRYAK